MNKFTPFNIEPFEDDFREFDDTPELFDEFAEEVDNPIQDTARMTAGRLILNGNHVPQDESLFRESETVDWEYELLSMSCAL